MCSYQTFPEVFAMKKLLVSLTVSLALCFVLATSAFAVVSPEHDNTTVTDKPTSPQTGYELGIGSVAAAAVLCGGVAVITGKKARG